MNALQILLIEDDPGDAELVDGLLQQNPAPRFRVQRDDRLAAGLERNSNQHYDAMLLDLGLPDSQGLETVEIAAGRCQDTPILVLTGGDEEELGANAMQLGADDFIPKTSLSRIMLVRAIRHAIERRNLQRKLIVERESRATARTTTLLRSSAGESRGGADDLSQMSKAYGQVIESYVKIVRSGGTRPGDLVHMLSQRLSAASLSARDIIGMHLKSIKDFENLPLSESQQMMQAARLCLVEILGGVLDDYGDILRQQSNDKQ